jgi:hypothetical protein
MQLTLFMAIRIFYVNIPSCNKLFANLPQKCQMSGLGHPFNVHPPLWTRSIEFEPQRKKRSKCRHKHPPEINKFLPYPSEKTQRSKDADAHNPSEMAFSNPFRNSRP